MEALMKEKSRLLELAMAEVYASQRSQREVIQILNQNNIELHTLQSSLSGSVPPHSHPLLNSREVSPTRVVTQYFDISSQTTFPKQQYIDISPTLMPSAHTCHVLSPVGGYTYPAPVGFAGKIPHKMTQVSPGLPSGERVVRRE